MRAQRLEYGDGLRQTLSLCELYLVMFLDLVTLDVIQGICSVKIITLFHPIFLFVTRVLLGQ